MSLRIFQSLLATAVFLTWNTVLAKDLHLVFEDSVQVSEPTREGLQNTVNFEPGKDITLTTDKPYWIQSKGKVPIMLVPVTSDIDESIKVQLTDVATWPPESVDKEIDQKLSTMMDLITRFQIALTKKDHKEAERLMAQMTVIKNVPSLEFLRAYLAFLKGDMEHAKSSVKKGLERYPAHIQGQQLLNVLEGKKNE